MQAKKASHATENRRWPRNKVET